MKPSLQVRPLRTTDLDSCVAIDDSAVPPEAAWSLDCFEEFFNVAPHGGYLALGNGRPVGYLLYQADRQNRRLFLGRIQVLPAWRRRGVGSRLVQHVRQWLQPVPDIQLCAVVHECCLPLQCFLRANGLTATRVFRGRFDGGEHDAYLFEAGSTARAPALHPETRTS